MNKAWTAFPLSILFIFVISLQVHALGEEEKIMMIIESIKDTPEGTQFIRNDKLYSADNAVSHLKLKYSKTKSRVKTAEDFITYVASSSSISGKEYLLRYPHGTAVTAAAFLTESLHKLEKKK